MTGAGIKGVRVDRRTTIKWLAATMAAGYTGCSRGDRYLGDEIPAAGSTVDRLQEAATPGYGTDPDLINPVVPWPRTMTDAQLRATAALCDTILPEDERSPAASAVGVPDFIDEWISAPYAQQRSDRDLILSGLEWLEQTCRELTGSDFAAAPARQKEMLLDLVDAPSTPAAAGHVEFFRRFRYLTVGAFYTTDEGIADIGYIGNVPISGRYPGPSDEAMAHLAGVLEQLGLT